MGGLNKPNGKIVVPLAVSSILSFLCVSDIQ
jgi:hypothetical protein